MTDNIYHLANATIFERAIYATQITHFVRQQDLSTLRPSMLPNPTSPTLWALRRSTDGLWLLGNAIAAGVLGGAYARYGYKPENIDVETFHMRIIETALVIDDDLPGALAACGLPVFERRFAA
jgi:hypothetical protein